MAQEQQLKELGLVKYWNQRYNMYSKFDEGIQLDPGLECFSLKQAEPFLPFGAVATPLCTFKFFH